MFTGSVDDSGGGKYGKVHAYGTSNWAAESREDADEEEERQDAEMEGQ